MADEATKTKQHKEKKKPKQQNKSKTIQKRNQQEPRRNIQTPPDTHTFPRRHEVSCWTRISPPAPPSKTSAKDTVFRAKDLEAATIFLFSLTLITQQQHFEEFSKIF